MKTRKNYAFTLVELLVVITIISLLLAILLPALGAVMESGLKKSAQGQIQRIETALRLYEGTYRDYPPSTIKEMGILGENKINSGSESLVLCLSSMNKTAPFMELTDDQLDNADRDKAPKALNQINTSSFKTDELFEIIDPWGNAFVYFHHRDIKEDTNQLYIIEGSPTKVTPYLQKSKTGNYRGYGNYQVLSSGSDLKINSEDDLMSK